MNNLTKGISVLVVLGATLWLLTPAHLQPVSAEPVLPDDLDAWLQRSEKQATDQYGLVPDTEKRITWFGEREQTAYSVLYLHGFSATRQETAPLSALVASALNANLFETRLRGHGRQRELLGSIRAEDWLNDAAEALSIAARLGKKVIVIGTSTGATLAAAMLGHPAMDSVDTIVMMSPNFAPRDPGAAWLTRPAGPLLAKLLVGDTRSWQPHNEAQALYWSTTYPTASAVEMMRLVDLANRQLPASVAQRLLLFYSDKDSVVSPDASLSVFNNTDAPRKAKIVIDNPGDPSHHVLAGDVLSAQKTQNVANDIVEFISRPMP